MKKILLILLLTIFFIPNVDADTTTIELMQTEFIPYSSVSTYEGCVECGLYLQDKYIYNDWDKFYSNYKNRQIFNNLYESGHVNDSLTSVLILSNSSSELDLFAIIITYKVGNGSALVNQHNYSVMYANGVFYPLEHAAQSNMPYYKINNYLFYPFNAMPHHSSANPFVVGVGNSSSAWFYLPTTSFMNDKKYYNQAENTFFKIYNSSSELINTISYGSELPSLYSPGSFDPNALYTEVNLDNYEYVILSLKDYTQKDAFDTNLQVKGMIGVTPVYEYGTAQKDSVTDRCNVSYSDYTDYRFYVLKNDLLNNAVYYVKACEEGSTFKFDNTIFNATYITTETVNDPVITVGGVQYNVIPFDKLSNTANKNEEENFVPGESGSSLTDIIDNTTNYISSFWNSLSTFMSLVTKFFNTLPIEIRAICITTFATACTLGLLKILKS